MVRRPMFFAACSAAGAVFVSYYAGILTAWIVCFAAFAGTLLLWDRIESKRRLIALILVISCFFGAVSFWHEDSLLSRQSKDLTGTSFFGEITSLQTKTNRAGDAYIQLTIRSGRGSVLARCYDSCPGAEEAAEGCTAKIRGDLVDPDVRRNPGCFDYALHLKSQGITKTVRCDRITVYPPESFIHEPMSYIRNKVFLARERFLKTLKRETDLQTAAIIQAILFGDKGSLDGDLLESFQKNGTAHILAVSGLHIGIIYGFILSLWRWRKGWMFLGFNGAFFFLYAVAAGFSPSVTRAVIMVLLHIFAQIKGKRYDLGNAAMLIILITMLRNPYMLFNIGFQMSFLAVLTIALLMPYIRRVYSGVLMMSLVVQLGLGPFMIYHFNYFSLISVIVNVPVVALASGIVPLALISMALSPFAVFSPAAGLLSGLCSLLIRLNDMTQIDGVTSYQIPSPHLWLIAAYYLGLLFFATEEGRLALLRAVHKRRYVLRVMVLSIACSLGFAALASDGFEKCNLIFVDVGQGDCTCVIAEGGLFAADRCFLFDGGGSANYNVGKSILRNYLLKSGIGHVDGAFVTHLHTDHYKGICELAKEGMVDRIYVYEANKLKQRQIQEDTGLTADRIEYLGAGDHVQLTKTSMLSVPFIGLRNSDSVDLEVLHPEHKSRGEYAQMIEEETDENLLSLLFRVTFSNGSGTDGTSILITGDMGEEGEQELLDRNRSKAFALHADVLKVGHHGSKTSTTELFLEAVAPQIAVIQVGKNNTYGHPTPEVLMRLSEHNVPIYRNDLQGAVGLEIKHGTIREIKTMIHP